MVTVFALSPADGGISRSSHLEASTAVQAVKLALVGGQFVTVTASLAAPKRVVDAARVMSQASSQRCSRR